MLTGLKNYTGADELVRILVSLEVDTIFCVTGAGNLALVDALIRDGRVQLIYCHHEQAAVMAAQGYSRVSAKVGVALVTTGGGAANALTGALSAQLDSVPVLLVTGNESSFHCRGMAEFRAYGVQGFDAVSVYEPIAKFASRIMRAEDIGPLLIQAWQHAESDRKGVAVLDFPMDLQRRPIDSHSDHEVGYPRKDAYSRPDPGSSVEVLSGALSHSEKPLLYLGNGVRNIRAVALARKLIDEYSLPFVLSWSAIDMIEDSHPLNMGRVGIYGDRASNILLQKADLLLCIGTRLAIPQIGYDQEDFARRAERWVVDIDPVELSKFTGARWNLVHADAQEFLELLTSELAYRGQEARPEWIQECTRVWEALPREAQVGQRVDENEGFIHSCSVIEHLNEVLPQDAVVVTDVGAGLLSGHYAIRPRLGQRIFTSQGLGEMGFGLPAAIGAYFADVDRPVICLNTDGGVMFNLQELQTARFHNIPLKLFIFNNDGYSMIRISQTNLFKARYAGIDPDSGLSFPDFARVADTFGFRHHLIDDLASLKSILPDTLRSPKADLFEIRMSPNQKYLPRLATTRLADGTLSSPPIEDQEPYLPIQSLESLLGAPVHKSSYQCRGIQDG